MPFDTKERIAQTVLELIRQQPVSKITVQRIMEESNMKRQSFYYHFKDIYDVLDWSVTRYFCEPFSFRAEQPFEDWCEQTLSYLSKNQSYARRIALALGQERICKLFFPVVEPQVDRLFFSDTEPDEDALLARSLITRTITDGFFNAVTNRSRIRVDVYMRYVRALMRVFNC